jgi:hypothetical protein
MLTVNAKSVRQQLNRITDSTAFADAERARRFLRYLVERKLEGRDREIKESVTAIEVLGRNVSSTQVRSDCGSGGGTAAGPARRLLRGGRGALIRF